MNNDKRAFREIIKIYRKLINPLQIIEGETAKIRSNNQTIEFIKGNMLAPTGISVAAFLITLFISWAITISYDKSKLFMWGIPIIVLIVVNIIHMIKQKSSIKSLEFCNSQIERGIGEKLTVIKDALALVPPKYISSAAVSYFVESFENARIDTLKEAVNLFDTYIHREKLENGIANMNIKLDNIAAIQEASLQQLRRIETAIDMVDIAVWIS